MKSRKERIQAKKAQEFTRKIKKVKKATTYVSTSLMVGGVMTALTSKAESDPVPGTPNQMQPQADKQQKSQQATGWEPTVAPSTQLAGAPTTRVAPAKSKTASVTPKVNSVQPARPVQLQVTAQPKIISQNRPALPSYGSPAFSANPLMFINQLAPQAQAVANQYGLYASLMIAQAALESSWGQSYLATAANNFFGVKWTGNSDYIVLPTQEFINGAYQTINGKFQRYATIQASLTSYANMITNNFPNSTRHNAMTVEMAAHNLMKGTYGTYATAPTYPTSLMNVIRTYNLTRFDQPGAPVISHKTQTALTPGQATGKPTSYTVKPGDSIWHISQRTGVSMENLIAWNKIANNFIYPNQVLHLTAPAAPTTLVKSTATTYQVKAGDSLWKIAKEHQVTVEQLKSLNNLPSNSLQIGQVLTVNKAN